MINNFETYRYANGDEYGDDNEDDDNSKSDYEIISMDEGDDDDDELDDNDNSSIGINSSNKTISSSSSGGGGSDVNYYCSNGNIEFLEKLIYSQFNDIQYPDVLESNSIIHENVENIVKLFKSNPSNQKFTFKTYLYTKLITYIGCTSVICKNCNYNNNNNNNNNNSDSSGTTGFHSNNINNNNEESETDDENHSPNPVVKFTKIINM